MKEGPPSSSSVGMGMVLIKLRCESIVEANSADSLFRFGMLDFNLTSQCVADVIMRGLLNGIDDKAIVGRVESFL